MSTPAFPVNRPVAPDGTPYAESMVISDGMTLRDYFAAKALQGFCASMVAEHMSNERLACEAYEVADAMLKARGS